MHFPKLLAVAAVTLVASVAGAQAQQVQAGVLECHGGPNVGYVVGSSAELECVFRSKTGAPPQLELSLGPAPGDWLAQE